VPVKRSGTALTAEVTVEGAVMRAVIDTGFSSLIALSQGAADAAGRQRGRELAHGLRQHGLVLLDEVERARPVDAKRLGVLA
jgi:predicted aspartyl protease